MKKLAILLYGTTSYAVFLATFLYLIGFIGNLWVPKSIDSVANAPLSQALLINACLLAVFAVQHSVMARPFFKRWITRYIPQSAERSTYVLATNIALILLVALWEPMGGVIWEVRESAAKIALYGVFAAGWALVLVSTFLLNHFDLFGLRQVWLQFRGREYQPVPFAEPWIYRHIRHPLYLGMFLGIWATPTMTVAHLVFALLCSAYIHIGTRLEERDLVNVLPQYAEYARKVPRFLPRIGSRRRPVTANIG